MTPSIADTLYCTPTLPLQASSSVNAPARVGNIHSHIVVGHKREYINAHAQDHGTFTARTCAVVDACDNDVFVREGSARRAHFRALGRRQEVHMPAANTITHPALPQSACARVHTSHNTWGWSRTFQCMLLNHHSGQGLWTRQQRCSWAQQT